MKYFVKKFPNYGTIYGIIVFLDPNTLDLFPWYLSFANGAGGVDIFYFLVEKLLTW